jgi:hypothetical protein
MEQVFIVTNNTNHSFMKVNSWSMHKHYMKQGLLMPETIKAYAALFGLGIEYTKREKSKRFFSMHISFVTNKKTLGIKRNGFDIIEYLVN